MENWYLICHKPGRKNLHQAKIQLEKLNIKTFSPKLRSYRLRSDRPGQVRKVIEPLFPGYIFINFDPYIHAIYKIEHTPGVSHVVRFSSTLSIVSNEVINSVKLLQQHSQELVYTCFSGYDTTCKTSSITSMQEEKIKLIMSKKNPDERKCILHSLILEFE
ncbi:Transcriptional activator rfaH [Serratia quinivorans]|uniref:transcription termination/antitermination NusG family protein n=1 Tax=Serratia TaxID=613 RepID=UPI001F4C0F86|nr:MULTISPECIES: transcription termination/antitermination NusG family protein [Serratia]ULG15272.1 hypothetical protein 299p_00112 [Serratia proteamaculans]ULG15385.1 hypothetical protein 336p_00116 [Serratia proteamaculans]ULG15601.1 hypothetical protein 465p1_00002 [Serratia proteamaculans]CAI0813842.1 Transcriptional activator rfaH [Serratia quinivorans]CAI1247982.1 Transcriptional activator rfaH [Serratia quinivorans]